MSAGRAAVYTPAGDGWTSKPLDLPDNATIGVVSTTDRSDDAYLDVTGFLHPTALWSVRCGDRRPGPNQGNPRARFEASGDVVEQFEAISTDGTKIPYFVVHKKGITLDGTTPTIMTAYGGVRSIDDSLLFRGRRGKLWLERGGQLRARQYPAGGGEFGPKWHEARGARPTARSSMTISPASRRICSSASLPARDKLGIYGGSNGGLLMGVESQPASRSVEGGRHPSAAARHAALRNRSRRGPRGSTNMAASRTPTSVPSSRKYRPIRTSKRASIIPNPISGRRPRDDRVGPEHARKFAARMKEYGLPYLYYEDTAGGHSGDADIAQGARLQALQMVYFLAKADGGGGKLISGEEQPAFARRCGPVKETE